MLSLKKQIKTGKKRRRISKTPKTKTVRTVGGQLIEKQKSGRGFCQGYYTPKYPDKYRGDPTKIRFLSSWELQTHRFLDFNSTILEWASEPIAIPYYHPYKKNFDKTPKITRYYPDYWVRYKNRRGQIVQEVWEVKPEKQSRPPRKSKNKKQNLYEQATYNINLAKWDACYKFCNKYGMKFRILTEKDIYR